MHEPGAVKSDVRAADQLWRLWREGGRPDLDAFFASAGPLTAAEAAAALRIDQRERWQAGERILVEEYLGRRPDVAGDPECALDLIFNEFLIRERLGDQPDAPEYEGRFHAYSGVLKDQIELHRAMAAQSGAESMPPPSGCPETPAAAPSSFLGPAPSDAFGRYRLFEQLGRGGMGVVYLAHDTHLDRRVALKISRFGENEPERAARFLREARIAAAFTHPNLCPVYDHGATDGFHFLTMPVIRGEPLSALLRREGPLPETTAVRLAVLVARAVHAAHQAGVIHRDLKPANVMVNERGEPVVMDFGLARRAGPLDARTTVPGVLIGTPAYAAPEQIRGVADAGPACDVYSLGVMLYEMLTGRLPFLGDAHEVLTQVLLREPAPPSHFRPDLDRRLERVCLTAMAKDPKARFASLEALADALEGRLEPAAAPPPRMRRNGLLVWLLAVLAAAIALATALWLARPRPTVAPPPASGPGAAAPAADAFQAGSEWDGAFRWIPVGDHDDGDVHVVVAERDGARFRGIYATEAGAYQWEIEGTVQGGKARWGFTRVLREQEPRDLVGHASVEAQCDGDRLEGVYQDQDSMARLTLHLWKQQGRLTK
ncbi:MAG TPA: serine/threonine-protein kinase [Gemmataceae bacterium]|nr:serine/threonine-protein kinase [Gemmataceae bacterium]